MSDLNFKANYTGTKDKVEVSLSLLKFKEDGVQFIYSPSLDLTGYGKDPRSAKRSFEIVMEEFVNYTTNKGTLVKELQRLGWKISGSKRKPKYQPPFLDQLFIERPFLSEIFRDKEFHRYEQEVLFPAA